MDWLIQELKEGYALVAQFGISLGTLGVVAWNTLVGSRLGSKRVDRLLNFTTVAHKTITDVKGEVGVLFQSFKNEMVTNVIKPLQTQLQGEIKEKQFWQDMAISALAVANVPLNQKQAMFDFAKKATTVSQEAISILGLSIQNDIAKQQIATQSQDALKDAIKGV